MDWLKTPAVEQGRAIMAGLVSPLDLAEGYLDAIARAPLSDRIYARTTPDRARAEAIAALQADFTWITDVLLNMDGSVLSLEGEPATTEQVAMFLTFVADLAIRDEAAAYSLEIDGAMEIPFFETREAAVAAA